MSVWATVSGNIAVVNPCPLSVRKLAEQMFDELNIDTFSQTERRDRILTNIDFTFCADGIDAARLVDSFVKAIKQFDKTAKVDVTAAIRFLA